MNRFIAVGVVILVAMVALFFALRSNPDAEIQENVVVSPMAADNTAVTPTPGAVNNSEVMIQVTPSGFNPQTVTVKAGTKVSWINNSGQSVSINSAPHPLHSDYPPLNLGRVDDGGLISLVFDKAGTYGYHNHLNPSWTGDIVVE